MLQLRKKSKLYTQLDLVKLGHLKLGHFKIYIRSFVDYQHLQKYFYNWNITWNYSGASHGTTAFSVKSISGINLSGNTLIASNTDILTPLFCPF